MTLPQALATWSFSSDSKRVIGLARTGQMGQWEGPSFAQIEPLVQVTKTVPTGSALISSDANLLAIGSIDGVIQVWNLSRRALQLEVKVSTGQVWPVAFLAQGTKLAVLLADSSIHEWDLASGRDTRILRSSQ